MVGTIATIAVVGAVFCSAVIEGDETETLATQKGDTSGGPYRDTFNASGLPLAMGLIAYCFSGHAIVPSIYSSMKEPQHFERMINATFLIVVASSFLVATSGYYMFGDFVEDQVTLSLEAHAAESGNGTLAMKMLTWLMIMTAFSKFTLTMFPLALGVEEIIAPYIPSENVMEFTSSLIKLVLIAASLMVAIFVPSFSFLCSLVGMICTMIVSCIFPAAAHLKLFGPKLGFFEKLIDWVFIIFGSFTAVVGTIATVGM